MQANGNDKYAERGNASKPSSSPPAHSFSILRIPPPVQRLFEQFPRVTLPPNQLPLRSPRRRDHNALYIFTSDDEARVGAPSFNPGCLKWQTLLNFAGVSFRPIPSSNHASPSGALPFLIPAATRFSPSEPITTSKLESWIETNTQDRSHLSSFSPRLAAYATLVSHNIRLAYLYALYLYPATFKSIASPLYIETSSRSSVVRLALEGPLRTAALSELISTTNGPQPIVDVEKLLVDADDAFGALSTLLGEADWFSDTSTDSHSSASLRSSQGRRRNDQGSATTTEDQDDEGDRQRSSEFGLFDDLDEDHSHSLPASKAGPGMLDATVFAYTHVILSLFHNQEQGSPARKLYDSVAHRQNLLDHRDSILRLYFSAYHRTNRD